MIPRQSPWGAFPAHFKRYDSDEDENELEQARDLYRNQEQRGRPLYRNLRNPSNWEIPAWQQHARQFQRRASDLGSQLNESRTAYDNLQRRHGETQQDYERRAVEYEQRIREGEDARSLLGSQLDEARSQYDADQSRWGDEQSLYQGRIADLQRHQENQQKQFNKYIHKPEIADQILRKKYNLEKGLYDLTMKKPWPDVKNYADEQGYTGNYQKYADQYISGTPQQKPFMSYEDFEKRNHNKAFMNSLRPQFEAKYPQGERTEAEHLAHLGYGDPTYTKDPVEFLKQYKKYYPFANEDTYQKYQTTDKFRDLSPASKQYLNIDQPNFKNFNKIYKQKFRDQESMAASEMQSQMERMSESYDSSIDHFARLLQEQNPQRYNEIMSDTSQTPKFSQMSRYSSMAPSSFAESIRSSWNSERQGRQASETELSQIRSQYDKHVQDYNRLRATSDQEKNRLTGETSQWKAKHDALLPVVQEFEINKPRLAEYPALADFRKRYNHVNLKTYAQIPQMQSSITGLKKLNVDLGREMENIINGRRYSSNDIRTMLQRSAFY